MANASLKLFHGRFSLSKNRKISASVIDRNVSEQRSVEAKKDESNNNGHNVRNVVCLFFCSSSKVSLIVHANKDYESQVRKALTEL